MKFNKNNNVVFLSLICILVISGVIVNLYSVNYKNNKQKLLYILQYIPNWDIIERLDIDAKTIESLDLDDYLFQKYSDGKNIVTLYIGYYYSAKKVGAAHDPMVCYPGQGWNVNKTSKGMVRMMTDKGIDNFSYSTISAYRSEQAEYILYWFQAFDEPTNNTLLQKIKLLKKNIQGKGQDNAFVRVSMPCSEEDKQQCERNLLDFINDFYPIFLRYVVAD